MEELNQQDGTQAPLQPTGNDVAGGVSLDAQSTVTTSADNASILANAGDAPNVALAAADQSASGILSSALNASQDAGTAADASLPAEPDHKGILATLLADLEGIVHMGKSEIIAVVERAKSLL